jgi:hypothetical protein
MALRSFAPPSILLLGLLPACSGHASSSLATAMTEGAIGLSSYDPAKAAGYADSHWSDGVGLCSQFTSDSLIAGGASIEEYTWVPDLWTALTNDGIAYDEYNSPDSTVGGRVGDVVFFSDAAGNSFCLPSSPDEDNCGHVGIVVVAGGSINTILADFHNNAHYHIPVGDILGGGYTTLRVYHVAAAAASAAGGGGDAGASSSDAGASIDGGGSTSGGGASVGDAGSGGNGEADDGAFDSGGSSDDSGSGTQDSASEDSASEDSASEDSATEDSGTEDASTEDAAPDLHNRAKRN